MTFKEGISYIFCW